MELFIVLLVGTLGIISWFIWAIIAAIVFFLAVGIPWAIWEGFMYITFNNIINAVAKIPLIGPLFAFIFTLPFAAIAFAISLWAYLQTFLMGLLTFRGNPNSDFCQTFLQDCVVPLESGWPESFFIVRFYYDHCQWIWGGAGFFHGWFPWQNGCGSGIFEVGEHLPVPFMIIKLILLALPYTVLFLVPLVPLIWCIFRPIVGALASLPSISQNGNGRH